MKVNNRLYQCVECCSFSDIYQWYCFKTRPSQSEIYNTHVIHLHMLQCAELLQSNILLDIPAQTTWQDCTVP